MNETQILDQAEQLLQSKEFSAAIDLLRSVDTSELTPASRGRHYLLLAEACLTLGDYSVEACIDEALELFRFGADTESFAHAKYLKGWYLSLTGRHFDAEQILLESYVHFRRCNQLLSATKVLNRLSYGAFQTGNIGKAIENLRNCLDICLQLGNRVYAVKVAHNLAYLLWSSGNLRESREVYLTYPLSQDCPDKKVVLNYQYMSAIPHALVGHFEQAESALHGAEPYLHEFPREHAIFLENKGWVTLLQGRFDQAIEILLEGLLLSVAIAPDSALVSQIKRLLADCSIAKAKFKNAKLHATEALAVAEKIGQRVEIAACYRVFAQVAAHDGKADVARRQFKAAIELFNQISSRYELAVTRYLAASSGLFEKGESLAMLFLAKEYCEAEQVAPYIARIDTALAKLEPRKPALSPINRTIDGPLIAANKKMLSLLDLARHVALTNMTVLLTGETGTGKDLLARWIHDQSGRTGRFLSQNFAALPSGLEESELFGHRKGAFTNAVTDKEGLFEAAEHGTFFLNEIADSPMELQAKLLEVLETRSIRRIGETHDRPIDIRIIAATNHDLAKMVRENRFRVDLFHRLNEINITLPPLAARTDDIPLLVQQFIADSGVTVENGSARHIERLSSILAMREWPGNIRELRTFVRKLMMIADNDISKLVEIAQQEMPDGEEMQLARILEQSDWNQTRVADALGLSEGAVRKRIRKYGLDRV